MCFVSRELPGLHSLPTGIEDAQVLAGGDARAAEWLANVYAEEPEASRFKL